MPSLIKCYKLYRSLHSSLFPVGFSDESRVVCAIQSKINLRQEKSTLDTFNEEELELWTVQTYSRRCLECNTDLTN